VPIGIECFHMMWYVVHVIRLLALEY